MKLFGLNFGRQQKSYPLGGSWTRMFGSSEPFSGAWQRDLDIDKRDTLMSNSAVYACVTRIANDIAKLPVDLIEKRDDDLDIWTLAGKNSPYWRPLIKPNLVQNRIQFFTSWLLSKLQYGNTYVLKEREEFRGIVRRLYILPPNAVKPVLTPDGTVFYRVTLNQVPGLADSGKELHMPADEIIHDLMNPLFHPLCGVPPLFACALSATQTARIQRNMAIYFENMSRPSGLMTTPETIGPELAKQYKEEWEKNYSGGNLGRVAIMSGGLKFEPIGWPAIQSQVVEQLRWTVEDVARAFSMPLYKIGAGPVPISNNAEILNQQYYEDCLQLHMEAIELCLNEGLGLTNVPGQTLATQFDLDVLLRMDSATQVETLDRGVRAGIYSINEARLKRNLPPTKGGEQPYLQQQNYPLASLVGRTPPDESKPALAAPAEPKPPPGEPDNEKQARAISDAVIAKFFTASLQRDAA